MKGTYQEKHSSKHGMTQKHIKHVLVYSNFIWTQLAACHLKNGKLFLVMCYTLYDQSFSCKDHGLFVPLGFCYARYYF